MYVINVKNHIFIMIYPDIYINIYDLSNINKIVRKTNLGIYHTSVVIDNEFEIYYGYYSHGCTGIDYAQEINKLPSSMEGIFFKKIYLGKSNLTIEEIKKKAKQFSYRANWLSNRYHVLCHNCHTFSYKFCQEILESKKLLNFPMFVFESQKIGFSLYKYFVSPFIDEKDPPYFLNKFHEINPLFVE